MQQPQPQAARRRWYWLLVIPYVAMLWVTSFNRMDPMLWGIPFFYWYQFVWIAGTALVVLAVYILAHGGRQK
jgi:Protein of unknown function (DUF3311)